MAVLGVAVMRKRLLALVDYVLAFARSNAPSGEQLFTFGLPVVWLAVAAGSGGPRVAFVVFAVMYTGFNAGRHVTQQRYEKICAEYRALIEKSAKRAADAIERASREDGER